MRWGGFFGSDGAATGTIDIDVRKPPDFPLVRGYTLPMTLNRKSCYAAVTSRDARFDGRFFTAVHTTGIYCRPVCPAPAPLLKNVEFYSCAAAAEEAGFRPCRRCRPESSPGTPAWAGTSTTVSRAMNLIAEGALDSEGGARALAERLGLGERHLRRLFLEHLGTTPGAIARTRRAHFARQLIDETDMPMTRVALSAGYSSVRRFNEAIKSTFGFPPRELRRKSTCRGGGGRGLKQSNNGGIDCPIALTLPYRPPFDWEEIIRFFGPRVTPGVEEVGDEFYRRTITMEGGGAVIEVVRSESNNCLILTLPAPTVEMPAILARVRRLFDLGADPLAIGRHLGKDKRLARLVELRPGIRLPGGYDRFEMAVRAIAGQQISVKGATTLTGRLAEQFGEAIETPHTQLNRLFPKPAELVDAPIESIGMPGKRAGTIRELSRRVGGGEIDLDAPQAPEELMEALQRIPGIGEWTAEYIAMRALPSPNAFPAGDLGIRKALVSRGRDLKQLTGARAREIARPWQPWRAYAVMHLWRSLS